MLSTNLLNKARASVKEICLKECKGLCCRKGQLLLKTKEEQKSFQGFQLNKEEHGFFSVTLPCPQLQKDSTCIIYTTGRPEACSASPLFLVGKTIIPLSWCPAVQSEHFFEYYEKLEEEGYIILKPSSD